MPLKVVSNPLKETSKWISKSQIQQLSDRFRRSTFRNRGSILHHRCDDHDDTKSCWFSTSEILALLEQNGIDITKPEGTGVRIYFGMHHEDNDFQPTNRVYIDKREHTVILVATITEREIINHDQLDDDKSFILTPLGSGDGMDNGTLCPPDNTCGGMEIQ